MFTVFKRFDVPGLFVRDLGVMVDFATEWYAKSLEAPKTNGLPWKLVYVTDNFSIEDTPQKRCVMGDLRVMELILGVEAIGVSVEDLWNTNPLENANRESLRDFLKEVGASTLLYTNYHSATNFRADDRKVHGIDPPVSKFVQWRWYARSTHPCLQMLTKTGRSENSTQKHSTKKACAAWTSTSNGGSTLSSRRERRTRSSLCRAKTSSLTTVTMHLRKFTISVKRKKEADRGRGYHVQDAWHPWWVAPILGAPEIVVPGTSSHFVNSRRD
jgi:hypothetical protein